jgi:hypothetical protein
MNANAQLPRRLITKYYSAAPTYGFRALNLGELFRGSVISQLSKPNLHFHSPINDV